jgi:beta-lactamase regulating signal transducer with metallopeptidase domain/polyhydroxyalkanoate synthesis regulator phasin
MSAALLGFALHNTVLASGLAVLALLAARLLPRRPGIAHTLWILVLLKLITPPFWTIALWPAATVQVDRPCPALPAEHGVAPVAVEAMPDFPALAPSSEPAWWTWGDALALVALLGTLAYVALASARLWRLHRLLQRLPKGEPLPELLELAETMGVAPPRLRWSEQSFPPLLLAVGMRPTLVLPIALWQALKADERRALLLHELAHLARGDHRVRLLELLVLALHWWNPLAWLAVRQLRRAEELCCDALVIATRPEVAPAYATALIQTLAYLAGHPTNLPAEASGAGPVIDIRRRLTMILQNRSPYVGRGGVLMAVVALIVLCPLVPTRAEPRVPDTLEGLIATQKSCQQCHAPEKPGKPDLPRLHDDVVRLMEELRRAKRDLAEREAKLREVLRVVADQLDEAVGQVAEGEAKLREVLREFEKRTAPKAPAISGEGEIRRLERQIQELRDQLERERKQPRTAPEKKKPTGQTTYYMNTREFKLPVEIAPEAIGSELRVFIQKRQTGVWELHSVLHLTRAERHVHVRALEDGEYQFALGLAPKFTPQEPGMHVLVDTKPPEVNFQGRRTAERISLEWKATDANLAEQALTLQYRDAKGEWRLYRIPSLGQDAQLLVQTRDVDSLDWRFKVRDKAGNETVKTLNLK